MLIYARNREKIQEMKKLQIMIVSLPGTWQRMIQKNIQAYSFVNIVDVVSGSLSASQLAVDHRPDLILIDSCIPIDDAVVLIQNLKNMLPRTGIIAIADTTPQQRRMLQSGADYAILSFNFEAQIGGVLEQLERTVPDGTNRPDAGINIDPSPTE